MTNPTATPMDYPYAVLPEADLTHQQIAAKLHAQLRTSKFYNELASVGLRNPDGTEGAGFQAPTGAPAASPAVTAPPASAGGDAAGGAAASASNAAAALQEVLGSWAAITLPGRVLAVFDVSGSMTQPVPTAGPNATRMSVTKAAAARGLGLFDGRWAVGMWEFATNLAGGKPYQELVKIGPLANNQQELAGKLAALQANPKGDTALYNTAVAAYTTVKNGWQAGKVNSVILFTDGKNDYDPGYTKAQMQAAFKKVVDPTKPVRLVIIGIGGDVDANELKLITDASGYGDYYIAKDPTKIDGIFLQAIGSRSGAKAAN